MSYRNDFNQYKPLTISLIKFHNTFSSFCSNVTKVSDNSVKARSLIPFIDEFVRQRLISQISIMLFLKNTSIKEYWYRSNKMLLLYPCASLDQIFTENVTQRSVTWLRTLVGKKKIHMRLHSQIKQKFVILWFLQCHGGLLFFNMSYTIVIRTEDLSVLMIMRCVKYRNFT